MSKTRKAEKADSTSMLNYRYRHLVAIGVLFASLIGFFHEVVFDGKVFVAADTVASKSFETLVKDAEQQGIFPLWNPYIFCGMPGYASLSVHGDRFFDITATVLGAATRVFGSLLNNPDVGWQLFYYLLLGIGIYLFVYDKVRNWPAALLAGLAVMHSTFIIILMVVGHMTKVPVIAFFPFIFMILERLRTKFDLPLSMALVVLIHFMFLPGHIQMIYYCYLALGLYYLFFLVRAAVLKEEWKGIVRSGLIFAAATGLAFAMTGDQYLSTLEYSKYSMRGADPIVPSAQAQAKGPSNGGLDYEYATSWSYSPGEMTTFVVPAWYGSGWFTYSGALTQGEAVRLNTYIGSMPFTDAPQYMGIVVLALAVIGFWRNRRDPFVQYTALLIVISLIVSFGREMPLLYDLLFNYLPMFNKFRIPSMVLILVQMMVPVLAGYGLAAVMADVRQRDAKRERAYLYAAGAGAAVAVIAAAGRDIVDSVHGMFFSARDVMQTLSRSYGGNQGVLAELHKTVLENAAADVTAAGLLIGALGLAVWAYLRGSLRTLPFAALVIALAFGDLVRVNLRPMETHHRQQASNVFTAPDYVNFLKQDTTLYRTLEFENGQPPYNNTLAYFRIQSAYGYQGAKMRQIQDMFDVVGLGNPLLWGLMNVKYIISTQPDSNQVLLPVFGGSRAVLYNRAELPRAFFVERTEVKSGIDILNAVKTMSFRPQEVAYVMEETGQSVEPPGEGASVRYTRFGIQDLELSVTATGNNLVFLSESWYPEGWKATVDGTEIPILRLNYMFRGVVVPKGEHTVRMVFEPAGFAVGKTLSLAINLLMLGGLAAAGVLAWMRRKNGP